MKKILSIIILLTTLTTQLCAQNIMTLSSGEGRPQDIVEIELSVTNTDDFIAFQTEIPLGENLSYVDGSAVLYREDDHQLVASVVNGTLKIYSYSLSLSSYSGNDGKIISFQLRLGNEPGNITLTNTKAKLSDAAGKELPLTTASGLVQIKAPKLEVTTPNIDYGHIPIRSSYNKTITVRNIGNESLTISDLLFSDETLSCPSFAEKVVTAGNSTSFTIVYSPISAGVVKHKITVVSDASNGNQSINVMADPYSVNELHLAKTSAFCDSIIDISISVNNMDALTGFQFCVKMPEALQYQNNSFELTERKDDHVAFASMRNDTLVMLAYSPSNSFFADNDGVIANFKVKVKGNSGTYYMYPKNTILTNKEAQNVLSSANHGYVTVKSPKINVNTTHELAASSVTETANELFEIRNNGNAPLRIDSVKFTNEYLSCSTEFPLVINNYKSEYINIVCNKDTEGVIQGTMRIYSNDPSNGLMLVKILGNRYEPNGLVINYDEITDARYLDVLVSLNNYSGVTAIQADFSYPKEYYTTSNKNITLTERCSDFTKTAVAVNDSTFKVLIFSMNNELISGNEGNIFKIRLTRKEGADNQTATVSLKNIILSDVKGNDKNSSGNQMKSVNLMSNVSVNCNPSNSGAVTGTGSYHKGTEVILTATPNVGYRFVNWTENNIVVSSDIEYLFTITSERNLVANFTLIDYDVTATVSPENSGSVTGAGNYFHGDEVTLTATPNVGYRFVNWTENDTLVSSDIEYLFTITSERNLVANFTLIDYDVTATVSPENSGTVTGAGNYLHGDEVTLTATPNVGYRFVNWTEDNLVVSSDLEYLFVITEKRNLVANFTLIDYDVTATVSPENSGTVTGAGNYLHGDEVTLTAIPNVGYRFINWTENDLVVSSDLEYLFTITENRNFVANFTLMDYDVTATVSLENSGTVTGAGNYFHGDEVTLTATPNVGYRFVNWTENNIVVSSDLQYLFTITGERNLVANFTLIDYDVTATVSPGNSGIITGAGNYLHGDEVILTAIPNVGYRFVNWTENDIVVSSDLELLFVVTENRNLVANFTLIDYDLTTSVNIGNSGTVTGAGNYLHGDEVTLTATPNVGYRFVNWTENDLVVSSALEYLFTITENRNLVANFTLIDYDVTATASPDNSGIITGVGNYLHGDEVTLTAIPNIGYRFVNWSENDIVVSSDLELLLTITSDRNIVANFTLLDYDVKATVYPMNSGGVTGDGNYYHGEEVTLTAIPNVGYHFVNWTENGEVVSEETIYTFVITPDRNLVANFTLIDYDVTTSVNIENSGTVTGAGNYLHGDEVTLTATPNVGYRFVNWTEDNIVVSSDIEYLFTITSERNLVANFTLIDYDVKATVSPENSGTVTGAGNYLHGDEVTLTAIPNVGYRFVNWAENDIVVSSDIEYLFTITSERNLVANFTLIDYDVTTSVNIENSGTVTGAGNYLHGDEVTLTATPNVGYRFVNWSENDIVVSSDLELLLTITSERNLVANFTLIDYDVTATVSPENSGTVTGAGNYLHGDEVTLTATPNVGYRFVNWTENNIVVSSDLEYLFVITSERNLVANFTLIDYDVTTSVNIENSGTVTGAGNYLHGDEVTLTATPNVGYRFVNWTENDIVVSSDIEYLFTITSERNLVANFTLIDYDVTAIVSPENSGTVTGAGNYLHGDEVTLTATPNVGYRFVNWAENDIVVSSDIEYLFTITSERNLVANFTLIDYDVTTSVNIENSGTVTGAGNYLHGDEVTLTATPNVGYRFVNWTEDNLVVSSDLEYIFTITENRNLVANFTLIDYDVTATVSPENSGTVTGAGNYLHGDEVTLTATPNVGYRFVNWAENDIVVSSDIEYLFTITENRNLVANFELLTYDVTITMDIENAGVGTGEGNYKHGDSVTVTVTPAFGYRFVNWTENAEVVSTDAEYTFIITSNRDLVANFVLSDYDVTVTVNPEEAGIVIGAGNYLHGDEVTLTATPNFGYKFVSWTENDTLVSSALEYLFTITENRNLVANFELLTYEVTVSVNIENAGTVTGAGNYTHGDEVMLTATPNENYKFVNWTENDILVSSDLQYIFTITENRNLVANFISTENVVEQFVKAFSVYPNPTDRNAAIKLGTVYDRVEVYNAFGVKLYEYLNVDEIDGITTSGVYVIRVFADKETRNCRIIVD